MPNEPIKPDFYDEEYWMGKDHKATKSGYFDYQHGSTHVEDAKAIFNTLELKGARVLDVGCCFGFQVQELNKLGVDAYGCDYSHFAVEKAYDPARIKWADACDRLPYEDGTFDAVFSLATFEHLPEDGVPKALAEVRRVLKPGGVFIVYPEVYGSDDPPRSPTEDASHITRKALPWWRATIEAVFPEGLDDDRAKTFVRASISAKRWGWTVLATKPKA